MNHGTYESLSSKSPAKEGRNWQIDKSETKIRNPSPKSESRGPQRNLREEVSTGRPVFLLAYTISQTLISITLLNLTYSSHPVDCTIIQFKAEDRCLGKQADNYILDTSALVSEIL